MNIIDVVLAPRQKFWEVLGRTNSISFIGLSSAFIFILYTVVSVAYMFLVFEYLVLPALDFTKKIGLSPNSIIVTLSLLGIILAAGYSTIRFAMWFINGSPHISSWERKIHRKLSKIEKKLLSSLLALLAIVCLLYATSIVFTLGLSWLLPIKYFGIDIMLPIDIFVILYLVFYGAYALFMGY